MREKTKDSSTEERIKQAARTVFYKKGFAATRTRDIAEEAGLNLALLNYYFRTKAKLFEIVMIEALSGFVRNMIVVLDNEKTTLEEKVQEIAQRYIDLILKEPEIPTFIVSEIRSNPVGLLKKLPVKHTVAQSFFIKQYQEAVEQGKITETNPLHFLMNLMGLVIFPFIAKPLIIRAKDLTDHDFHQLMLERKKSIPIWIKAMFAVSQDI